MLHKSLVAKVYRSERAAHWFSHERSLLRAPGMQNKMFPCGELFPEVQNGSLPGAKAVPGQPPLALLRPPVSGETGLPGNQEDGPCHPPACCVPSSFLPFPAQLPRREAEMPRPGPAVRFLEAVDGQLAHGPLVRSSYLLEQGLCRLPPPCLRSSPRRTRPDLGKTLPKSQVLCADSYLVSNEHPCEGQSSMQGGTGLRCCGESPPAPLIARILSEQGTPRKMQAPVIYLGTFTPRKCRSGPGGQE